MSEEQRERSPEIEIKIGDKHLSGNAAIAMAIAKNIGIIMLAIAFAIACYGVSFLWSLT